MWYEFRPYVSVAKRRANAAREVAKLKKKGQDIQPVAIDGRKIATTFWGQSWCKNLEAYSDFSNRLPRGRTYVCNGSVVDLQIRPGKVTALVSGSSLYRIAIDIDRLTGPAWNAIRQACAGHIGSIVELLQGRISNHVMQIVTQPQSGLFPKPKEIRMSCSCPDWAGLCKHLAATLYGIGARLDHRPELLFLLRQVDHLELVEQAVDADRERAAAKSKKKTIAAGDLADVFGIEMESAADSAATRAKARSRKSRPAAKYPLEANEASLEPVKRTRGGKRQKDSLAPVRNGGRPSASSLPPDRPENSAKPNAIKPRAAKKLRTTRQRPPSSASAATVAEAAPLRQSKSISTNTGRSKKRRPAPK